MTLLRVHWRARRTLTACSGPPIAVILVFLTREVEARVGGWRTGAGPLRRGTGPGRELEHPGCDYFRQVSGRDLSCPGGRGHAAKGHHIRSIAPRHNPPLALFSSRRKPLSLYGVGVRLGQRG